jgi:hypothetical protein
MTTALHAGTAEAPPRPRVEVLAVPAVALDDLWPRVEALLGPWFEDYPLEDLDDVRASIEHGHRALWMLLESGMLKAVIVTQIAAFPQARVLEIVAMAGKDVLEHLSVMDAWATELAQRADCSVLQVMGRRGWAGHFRKLGARAEAVIYRKRLGGDGDGR